MATGKQLKKILDDNGISASELSRQTKIPATTIRSAIANDSDLKSGVLLKIAQALDIIGIDVSELMSGSMTKMISDSNLEQVKNALIRLGYYIVEKSITTDTVSIHKLGEDTVEYVVDRGKLMKWYSNALASARPYLDDLLRDSIINGNEENKE